MGSPSPDWSSFDTDLHRMIAAKDFLAVPEKGNTLEIEDVI
jgi:hypothetical protein